jgi:hypothetical protein
MGAVALEKSRAQNSILRVFHGFRVGEDARQEQSMGFSGT